MTSQRHFFPKESLSRIRNATEKWYAQILLYLTLGIFFFVIDQMFVADLYGSLFRDTSVILNVLFMTGAWIPVFSNVIVIVLSVRARTLVGYVLFTAVLTYFLAVPYYFVSGGEARYGRDSFGVAGASMVWSMVWFWSVVIGLVIKFIMWRRTWHTNSK